MRSFNKAATTPGFKRKVKLANKIIENWRKVEEVKRPYYTQGLYEDVERNVFISVYISRKVKGLGAGRTNDCSLRFSWHHHPELSGNALSKSDLNFYYKKYDI
jgi:hypothetical protein